MTPKINKFTKISHKHPRIRAAIGGKGETSIATDRQTQVAISNI